MQLEGAIFKEIVRNVPLVSVDLIVRDLRGRVLVGLRNNRPARRTWFVPGGVIHKNERIAQALQRVAQVELGIILAEHDVRFFGVYEHLYADNFCGDPEFGTHYVVLTYEIHLKTAVEIKTDGQHLKMQWLELETLLQREDVHQNTRAYFVDEA